jgi:hypothetical protein
MSGKQLQNLELFPQTPNVFFFSFPSNNKIKIGNTRTFQHKAQIFIYLFIYLFFPSKIKICHWLSKNKQTQLREEQISLKLKK